jgi:hypothetical protein
MAINTDLSVDPSAVKSGGYAQANPYDLEKSFAFMSSPAGQGRFPASMSMPNLKQMGVSAFLGGGNIIPRPHQFTGAGANDPKRRPPVMNPIDPNQQGMSNGQNSSYADSPYNPGFSLLAQNPYALAGGGGSSYSGAGTSGGISGYVGGGGGGGQGVGGYSGNGGNYRQLY